MPHAVYIGFVSSSEGTVCVCVCPGGQPGSALADVVQMSGQGTCLPAIYSVIFVIDEQNWNEDK